MTGEMNESSRPAATQMSELRAIRIQRGVCVRCGGRRLRNRTLCGPCMTLQVDATVKDKKRKRQRGICMECSSPATSGLTRCDRCRAKVAVRHRKRYQDRRDRSRCVNCQRRSIKAFCKLCRPATLGDDVAKVQSNSVIRALSKDARYVTRTEHAEAMRKMSELDLRRFTTSERALIRAMLTGSAPEVLGVSRQALQPRQLRLANKLKEYRSK